VEKGNVKTIGSVRSRSQPGLKDMWSLSEISRRRTWHEGQHRLPCPVLMWIP